MGFFVLDDVNRRDFELLDLKNRGGLVRPSDDVVAVCKAAEHSVRQIIGTSRSYC